MQKGTDLSEDVGSSCVMRSNCFSSSGIGGFREVTPFIGSLIVIESGNNSPPPDISIGLPGPDGGHCSY
jgi:hypothetical protein